MVVSRLDIFWKYGQTSLYRHAIQRQTSLQGQFEWNDSLAQGEADK